MVPSTKTTVINLFAGPGSGKSTTASGLFFQMKLRDVKCELVTEYAKELVYENRSLEDGILIFAQQHRRMRILNGKVRYIITDSPLLLSAVYQTNQPESFHNLALDVFNSFDNINVFINRVKKYQRYGRVQDEESALALDNKIYELSKKFHMKDFHIITDGDCLAPDRILNYLDVWVNKDEEQIV